MHAKTDRQNCDIDVVFYIPSGGERSEPPASIEYFVKYHVTNFNLAQCQQGANKANYSLGQILGNYFHVDFPIYEVEA